MTNEFLIEKGYYRYDPTPFDVDAVVDRFQKRFDDDLGKKYFINVVRYSNDYIPEDRRGEWWTPFSYEYEVQVEKEEKPINLHFFANWTLEDVEAFINDFFEKMHLDYYERWDEQ